jgi:uncharacterized ParB-like nuclease family protein
MAIKLSVIIADTQRELEDTAGKEWGWAELLRYLRDGLLFLTRLIREHHPSLLETTQTVTATGATVTLSPAPIEIKSVKNSAGVSLTRLNPNDVPTTGETGDPIYYALEGSVTLRLYPAPTASTALSVRYNPQFASVAYDPVSLTDDDFPFFDEFEPFVREYMLVRAYNRGQARADVEAAFMQRHQSDILITLERREGMVQTCSGYLDIGSYSPPRDIWRED